MFLIILLIAIIWMLCVVRVTREELDLYMRVPEDEPEVVAEQFSDIIRYNYPDGHPEPSESI